MRSIADVVAATAKQGEPLPAPTYNGVQDTIEGRPIAFMVESMKRHMTDEGYQLALALHAGGYELFGHGFNRRVDVLSELAIYSPSTVVLQDKREWTGRTAGPGFDHRERFLNVGALRDRADVFKGTVLKDAHSDAALHVEAAAEIGAHFWIVYYHPRIVAAQSPFVRPQHLVRTYHSIDPEIVPPFAAGRTFHGILSGALSGAYPLRSRLALECRNRTMKHIAHYQHPGYGRDGCWTKTYINMLNSFRVAVCTSSRFGYAVRKIVEATAAGCVVVTDLPSDEVLPEIDGNLVRVDSDASPRRVDELVAQLCAEWDADRQRQWSERAVAHYDYRNLGRLLAADIEALRRGYNGL